MDQLRRRRKRIWIWVGGTIVAVAGLVALSAHRSQSRFRESLAFLDALHPISVVAGEKGVKVVNAIPKPIELYTFKFKDDPNIILAVLNSHGLIPPPKTLAKDVTVSGQELSSGENTIVQFDFKWPQGANTAQICCQVGRTKPTWVEQWVGWTRRLLHLS